MCDEDALPQRPNARRRMRPQRPEDQPLVVEDAPGPEPTTSGRGGIAAHEERGVAAARAPEGPPLTGPTALADAAAAAHCTASGNDGGGGRVACTPPRGEFDGAAAQSGDVEEAEEGDQAEESRGDGGGGGGDDDKLPAYRSAAVGAFKFEYLDHTADVQLHAWGDDLREAFENCALAMFNYMSPLEHVRLRERRSYRAEGHDLPSLLYGFLDELLFVFSTELFLAASVTITTFDRTNWVIEAEGKGETFDREVHDVGTEIKAITYSAMAISERSDDAEVFVIVDI